MARRDGIDTANRMRNTGGMLIAGKTTKRLGTIMKAWKLVGACGLPLLAAGCGKYNPFARLDSLDIRADNLEARVANLETKIALLQQWVVIFAVVSVIVMAFLYFSRKK